jgi:hypothetical protein
MYGDRQLSNNEAYCFSGIKSFRNTKCSQAELESDWVTESILIKDMCLKRNRTNAIAFADNGQLSLSSNKKIFFYNKLLKGVSKE